MSHVYSAGIITYYIDSDQVLYLLLHHTAGHWDFPKGTMENNETKQEAAIRELYEETGLTSSVDNNFEEISNYTYTTHLNQSVPKTVYFFTGVVTTKEVILSHEHINYAWLNFASALDQLTHERSKILLKKAHNYITNTDKDLI